MALKVAAEVLKGSARVTDRVGRIAGSTIGAVLVGCPLEDAPGLRRALPRRVGPRHGGTAPDRGVLRSATPQRCLFARRSHLASPRPRPQTPAAAAATWLPRDCPIERGIAPMTELAASQTSYIGFATPTTGITPPRNPERQGAFLTDVIVELGFADQNVIEDADRLARQSEQRIEQVLARARHPRRGPAVARDRRAQRP